MKAIEQFKKQIQKQPMKENLGQKEIMKLKDKYGYNPYGTEDERENVRLIDSLEALARSWSE